MKKVLKRVVAMLCAITMIAGGCFVTGGQTTKASDTTEQKEWVVASQVGDITSTSGHAGQIYVRMQDLNVELNEAKTQDDYLLYVKVYLQGDYAVQCMKAAQIEIANRLNEEGEIFWALTNAELHTGVNELHLPFKDANPHNKTDQAVFTINDTINHFRIFNINVSDCTGVILDDVKIVDTTPIVKTYTGAKATVAPTENVPEGYVFAGWYTNPECTKVLSGETTGTAYAKFVKEEVLGVKTQYVEHKGPRMLEDCDDTDDIRFASGTENTVTDVAGEFQEGEGAFKMADSTNNARAWIYWDDKPVNVSKYSTSGYLHFWFKIDDPTLLNDWFLVDIGHDTSNMRRWKIAKSELVSGWNEFYLPFAELTNAGGTVDFTKINMLRILTSGSTLGTAITTIVDDIRVVDSIPNVKISDCDSTTGLSALSVGTVTSTNGQYQEGSGAFILADETTGANVRVKFTLAEALNLSGYADGSLCFKIYIDDPTKLERGIIVDFGNNSAFSSNYYRWPITEDKLQSGWNEICLSLSKASSVGTPDITSLNNFRILQYTASTYNAMTTIVDDIRIETTQPGLEITDCDSTTGLSALSVGSVTSTNGQYQEGSGAFILADETTGANVRVKFTLAEALNLSGYADGSLCFKIYIDDPTKLERGIIVDFGNNSAFSSNYYRWPITEDKLQSGWNEICLSLSKASSVGTPDIQSLNNFRILQYTATTYVAMTTIVDDIRIETTQPGLEITDCDSTTGLSALSVGSVTSTNGQYQEGSGAFILADETTGANVRVKFTLAEALDLSEYADGSLCFKIYIDDPTKLERGIIVDFGNNSGFSSNYYRWPITEDKLQSGWNEICLSLSKASSVGTPDIKSLNNFRILQYTATTYNAMTTIVDNIRIEKEEVPVNTYADIRFVTTVDSIYYANVGFDITIGDKNITKYSNQVYGTLYGVSGDTTYTYSPTLFAAESEYFKAHTITNIPDTVFDTTITVIPFWTTQDGTKVSGTKRVCTINGEIEANENATPETDLRVVMSSDLHYTDLVDCYGTDKDARMQHWVDCIKAEHAKDPIDLLVINGDLSLDYWSSSSLGGLIENITDSENDMTEAFITNYLTPLLNETGIEVFVMPGNHELYTNDTWKTITGNERQGYKVVDNNLFICVDNYRTGLSDTDTNSDGTYTATDVNTIKTIMDANPNMDVYLISHYFDTAEDDTKDSNDRDLDTDLQTLLAGEYGTRIKGLFGGHSHEANVRQLDATWASKAIAQTGNFSYYFDAASNKPFWGFRELIITPDDSFSQYISVDSIEGCTLDGTTITKTRTTTDSVWFK